MKEFMIFILAEGNPVAALSPEEQQQHVQKVGGYIEALMKKGVLKEAQPLEMQGVLLSGKKGAFIDGPFNESKEVIAGYYHLLAENIDEAVAIAKQDPRFEEEGWRMEIRPVMTVEGIN